MTHRHSPAARALCALAAASTLIVAGVLAGAPRASAQTVSDPHCNTSDGAIYSACLTFRANPVAYRYWDAQVDFTIYLPEQYAREVVACDPGVRAVLWGDDGGGSQDDEIRHLWVGPGWPIAQPFGGVSAALFGEYIRDDDLDEDPDGTDELYARVSYWDCHTGLRRWFRTGTIKGNFG